MTPVSIHAVYDGEEVRLLEKAPVEGSYHVLVTFVEPVPDVQPSEQDLSGLWASFGAWRDESSSRSNEFDRCHGKPVQTG